MSWPKIPASGEGRVLAEIKGKLGGNMRRFRRGSGRFRSSRRYQRYWVPVGGMGGTSDWLPTNITNSSAFAPTAITPDPQDSIGTYSDSVARLLMNQGRIPIWGEFTGGGEEWQALGFKNQFVRRYFYWWHVKRQEASLAPDSATADSPGPNTGSLASGQLRNILQRKDVISWGYLDVPICNPRIPYYNEDAGVRDAGVIVPPIQRNGTILMNVPLPRIPRKGITFYKGDALFLNMQLVTSGNPGFDDGTDMVSMTNWYIYPLFRSLFAR